MGLCVPGQHGLHSEGQASQGYTLSGEKQTIEGNQNGDVLWL